MAGRLKGLFHRIQTSIAWHRHSMGRQNVTVEPTKVVRPIQRRIPVWYGLFPGLSKNERESAAWLEMQPWNRKGAWHDTKAYISKKQDERESGTGER